MEQVAPNPVETPPMRWISGAVVPRCELLFCRQFFAGIADGLVPEQFESELPVHEPWIVGELACWRAHIARPLEHSLAAARQRGRDQVLANRVSILTAAVQ